MRRIRKKRDCLLKPQKPVSIQVHPNLYKKMEDIRKQYQEQNISLSQVQLTNIISTRIRMPKIDLIGGKNVKKKK